MFSVETEQMSDKKSRVINTRLTYLHPRRGDNGTREDPYLVTDRLEKPEGVSGRDRFS